MDFIAGAFSGITQTIIGHPLDTIKVIQQNNIKINIFSSRTDLFQGLKYPLICNTILVGLQFDLYYRYNSVVAGLLTSFLITPFDYYKINKQNKQNITFTSMLKNFPKGYTITSLRECVALSAYFGSYDFLKKEYNLHPLISGGSAGVISWIITYPLDTIKTRIQSNETFNDSIRKGNLWKGIKVTIFRAVLVNSFGFYIAENIKTFK
jgi:solute carrier family 25 (mitochondrial carnitine/acylcarnitine transporter), member 20/29